MRNSYTFKHWARCVHTRGLNSSWSPHCHLLGLQDTLHGTQKAVREHTLTLSWESATQVETYFQMLVVNELERKGIKTIMRSLRKHLKFMDHLLLVIETHTVVRAYDWL